MKGVSSSFSKDLSHEAKAKTKDFITVLEDEDLSSRIPTLVIRKNLYSIMDRATEALNV